MCIRDRSTTGYLTWQGSEVQTIESAAPGYVSAPTDMNLTFSGDTDWNAELGSAKIQTDFFAENESGFVTGKSTPEQPKPTSLSADLPAEYAETALRIRTFMNRHQVKCGEQAQADRDDLILALRNAGFELEDILKYL